MLRERERRAMDGPVPVGGESVVKKDDNCACVEWVPQAGRKGPPGVDGYRATFLYLSRLPESDLKRKGWKIERMHIEIRVSMLLLTGRIARRWIGASGMKLKSAETHELKSNQ